MIKYSMEFPVAERSFWLPFCDFEFVLAHKVLGDKAYAQTIMGRERHTPVILDNSMHELGEPLSCGDIFEAAQRCSPDWVIPPDRLGEHTWNLDNLRVMCAMSAHGSPWRVASVMCGRDARERARTVEVSHALGCQMVCFPYREARLDWMMELLPSLYVSMRSPVTHIHLLGVSSLEELRAWAIMSERGLNSLTISVDTAKAWKWGALERLITDTPNLRNANILSTQVLDGYTADHELRFIVQNIHTLKAACQGR